MAAGNKISKNNTTEKTVTVYIPRKNKADTQRFVSVNGRNALIRTGEPVEVPVSFAQVINESIRADAEADSYTAKMSGAI